MKTLRFAMVLLLCLGVFLCLGAVAHAESAVIDSGACGDSLTWSLYDTGELVIDGTGRMANYGQGKAPWLVKSGKISAITIHDGVTSIGSYAFYGCRSLTSVTIPDSVTSIGWSAFEGCSGLTSVTIPEGVTSIRERAFSECRSLTSVTIPDSVTSIGGYAFYGCNGLTSVTIPTGVTSIGERAFAYCSSLTSVTIPDSVTSIGDYAFSGCSGLTSVTIPDSVTSIGRYAFYGCRSLTSVTIPGSVTSIGGSAFSGCSSLTSVTIREGVTSIGSWAFSSCSSLTSVTIPAGVTSIGGSAFYGCSRLKRVTIPGSVTSIGVGVFYGCSSLTSVTIREGVTSIGDDAFYGCSSLTSVTIPGSVVRIGSNKGDDFYDGTFENCSSLTSIFVDPANVSFCDLYGVLFDKSMKSIICFPGGRAGAYDIPEGVTSIGISAFAGCSGLTSVTIPESVTSIGERAFYGCSGLTSVTIPEGVTSIGDYAFRECTSLADVYYGGSEAQWKTITIGNYDWSLKNATIHYGLIPEIYTISYNPNGGKDAPASQQKTQNTPLTLSNTRPTREKVSAGTYSVRLNPNDGGQTSSILPAARTTTYSFTGWNTAADGSGRDYAPGASYTADADVTLYAQWKSSTKTASVTLPELARDDGIFKGWAESRDAESGVMGKYTPKGNVTLYAIWLKADFILPASLNTVESEAFRGGAFTYVLIPETVARIDGGAFASCPKLACAQFAGADTEIDPTAFDGVTGLTIIAPGGSTAEAFASAHGFDFMPAA